MATEIINGNLQIVTDPLQPDFQIWVRRDNRQGVMGLYTSIDGGKTLQAFVPAPTRNDRVGSTLTILTDGSVGWVLDPTTQLTALQRIAGGFVNTRRDLVFIDMDLNSEVFLNAAFGYFRVPKSVNYRLIELQVSIQTVGDTPIKIDLLDGADTPQNHTIVLPTGQRRASRPLPTPVNMAGNTVWSAKVLQCGTSAPGENLKLRLVLEPI